MKEYEKTRIARLFDDSVSAKNTTGEHILGSDKNIPQITGKIAFERLELKSEDVVLDVGTGTGDKAIAAAHICRQVIGIDISKKSLERVHVKAAQENVDNVIFAYGAFEEPCAELNLTTYGITKILVVYSLHHLPDSFKKQSLNTLVKLLHMPGRMVIGDIMFFEDPGKHRDKFAEIYYDAGDTDLPSKAEYLIECLKEIGANVHVEQIHPLVGIITADFQTIS